LRSADPRIAGQLADRLRDRIHAALHRGTSGCAAASKPAGPDPPPTTCEVARGS
jgi:hypothetical protein